MRKWQDSDLRASLVYSLFLLGALLIPTIIWVAWTNEKVGSDFILLAGIAWIIATAMLLVLKPIDKNGPLSMAARNQADRLRKSLAAGWIMGLYALAIAGYIGRNDPRLPLLLIILMIISVALWGAIISYIFRRVAPIDEDKP